MKNILTGIFFLLALLPLPLHAQEAAIQVHRSDGVVLQIPLESTDSLDFSADETLLYLHFGDTIGESDVEEIDSITIGTLSDTIKVTYSSAGPTAVNPYAYQGVDITIEDGQVTVTSTLEEELVYELQGEGTGSFKLYSSYKQELILNNLLLTSELGPAINIQSKKKTTITLPEGTTNTLTDSSNYDTSLDEDQKAALFSEGQFVFEGDGALTVTGNHKHAICSDDYIRIESGTITVPSSTNDGIHANDYFEMTGGTLTISGTTGDCVDADEGYVDISGGTITLTVSTTDTKALKCDSTMCISDGTFQINLAGAQSKGLKSGCSMTLTGGTYTFKCTGSAVVEDYEPSYCTAIKCDSLITIQDVDITITHTGKAGKGISSEQDILIAGGTITGTFSGAGDSYTTSDGDTDTYNATGIKADRNIFVKDGTLDLKCTGTGGKCIAATGTALFGDEDHCPSLTLRTTGSQILTTSSTTSSSDSSDGITVYVNSSSSSYYMYAWDVNNTSDHMLGDWPGTKLSNLSTTTVSGKTYYYYTFTGYSTVGVIFNTGNGGSQTADITVTSDSYFTYSGGSSYSTTSAAAKKALATTSTTSSSSATDELAGNMGGNTGGGNTGGNIGGNNGNIGGDFGGGTVTPDTEDSGTGNPKTIRVEGDITIDNGTFTISTTSDGGEGIESKSSIYVNGGTIECSTYDDCLNASTSITINDGYIYAYSSGNDGIDSNGDLYINGGTIVASGTSSPEEGIDSDEGTFGITGGVIFGIGGAATAPSTSVTTQYTAVWSSASASNGTVYTVCKSDGTYIMSFTIPRAYGTASILFSSPDLAKGSYTIYSGGTVSGGTTFNGLTTGATYTNGTSKKTFTLNSVVTTI